MTPLRFIHTSPPHRSGRTRAAIALGPPVRRLCPEDFPSEAPTFFHGNTMFPSCIAGVPSEAPTFFHRNTMYPSCIVGVPSDAPTNINHLSGGLPEQSLYDNAQKNRAS